MSISAAPEAPVVQNGSGKSKETTQKHLLMLALFEFVIIICYSQFVEYDAQAKGNIVTDNMVTHYYPMFQDVHVMIFVGFGFLMTFMKKYSFSAVTFNFLLAVVAIQYGILMTDFWHRVFYAAEHDKPFDDTNKIQLSIVNLICGDFAAGAVLISFGAVLGKASMEQLVTMLICEIIFYSINESIGVVVLKTVDMGGSMFVHTFGAYFGLGVSFMLSNKQKISSAASRFGSSYNSDIFAMIGTLFLWMFWPSFNGALAPGAQQHRVVINTVLALTNSCVGAVLTSKLLQPGNKLSMVDIQNATLAGGVAVGSSADLVIEPFGALVIGFLAGSLSVYGYVKITPFLESKFGLHDSCGVHNLHGMPGLMGGIGGAISAAAAENTRYKGELADIFSAIGEGRTTGEQGGFQFAALIVTVCFSVFGGLFTGKVMSMQESATVENYGDDAENWILEDEEEEEEVVTKKPINTQAMQEMSERV